jgi:hypothetical protein
MSIERRAKERVELIFVDWKEGRLPVWWTGHPEATALALLMDLSESGGRFLLSKESPLPRSALTVKIFPEGVEVSVPLEFRAEKLWGRTDMSPVHNVMGCRFLIDDQQVKDRLAQLVHHAVDQKTTPHYLKCELYYDATQKLYKDTEYL